LEERFITFVARNVWRNTKKLMKSRMDEDKPPHYRRDDRKKYPPKEDKGLLRLLRGRSRVFRKRCFPLDP
jgi:hypothetical protein